MTSRYKSAAILAVLCVLSGATVWGLTSDSRNRLAFLAKELARLRSEEATLITYVSDTTLASQEGELPAGLAWPQETLAQVELAMQEAILGAAELTGLSITSFGSASPDPDCVLACPAFDAEVEGGHQEVAQFLAALENVQPAFTIKTLWMRQLPPDGINARAPISLRISLAGVAPKLEKVGGP